MRDKIRIKGKKSVCDQSVFEISKSYQKFASVVNTWTIVEMGPWKSNLSNDDENQGRGRGRVDNVDYRFLVWRK